MKHVFIALVALLFMAPLARAADGVYPVPKAVAHVVHGRWTAIDPADPLTQKMSENALELMNYIQTGQIPLGIDMMDWDPAPHTIAQAFWDVKYKTFAKDIKYNKVDVFNFGSAHPQNVDEVIDNLVQRIHQLELYVAAHP